MNNHCIIFSLKKSYKKEIEQKHVYCMIDAFVKNSFVRFCIKNR